MESMYILYTAIIYRATITLEENANFEENGFALIKKHKLVTTHVLLLL